MVEIKSNSKVAKAMSMKPDNSPWKEGEPNPGWLKSSVWTSQLPYIVQMLDQPTLEALVTAYGTLDVVPEMALKNMGSPGPAYSYGGWIDKHVRQIMIAFDAAEKALDRLIVKLKSPWYERARTILRRIKIER